MSIKPKEHISGIVERITYHNPEKGFCVLKVKVKGYKDLICITGHASLISAGEYVQASGFWVQDKNHGLQFKAMFIKASAPTTLEGIERYLGSGMIKGIGPVYARKLVQAFQEAVFDVIENESDKLQRIEGIGPQRAARIIKGWSDQKAVREIMLFLHQYGVSTTRAVRIYKTFGDSAIQIISEDPYCLAREIKGIGFLTADSIAQKMSFEKHSLIRARAGISFALLEAQSQGHCGLPYEELIALSEKLLEIPSSIIEEAIELELMHQRIIKTNLADKEAIFLLSLYHAEKSIADLLKPKGILPWPLIDTEKAILWVEDKLKISLASSQKDALKTVLSSKVSVITGGPGVGKTTLIKSILKILEVKGIRILTCAPTGRAAKRLSESTGTNSKTIHRLLEIDPAQGKFTRDENNPLPCDLLVVDECSMIDVPLMYALLKALPKHAALILVGDIDQLPSVGPGQVLSDIIESNAIPVVRLTEIFRQAQQSKIIVSAHRINIGKMPDLDNTPPSDFYFIECKTPEEGEAAILKLIKERIPNHFKMDPLTEIQVLCPMNRGVTGTRNLNIEIQKLLNPSKSLTVERFGWSYCVGDKILQTENDYDKEVYNGDIGYISEIIPDTKEVIIKFEGRNVTYDYDELDQITLAYATTIHKSQGSEYRAIILPLFIQHYPMLQRKLIYTGVTRGKELVVIVAQKKALYLSIQEKSSNKRYTKLKEWLMQN
jgi:exodeoxyribonuclease V alpha subunit